MSTPRRDFLKTAAAAACAVAALPKLLAADQSTATVREFYDLRAYRLKTGAPTALLERYLETTLLPALKARKLGPIGMFNEASAEPATAHQPTLWVLVPYTELGTFVSVSAELNRDPAIASSAGEYFTAPTKAAPAYERIDSELLLAFTGQPKLRLPAAGKAASRVFELRRYESFSEAKALKKIDMFNAGEIEVMHEVGLSPVFYGQALVGRDLPHLSYMTSGPDMTAHKEHWKAFGSHPIWQKLKNDPQYADTVSQITKRFLTPTSYSEI